MERGQKISVASLKEAHWGRDAKFADCELWSLGERKFIYDPKTEIIIFLFKREDIPEEINI